MPYRRDDEHDSLPPLEERPVVLEFPDPHRRTTTPERPARRTAERHGGWLSFVLPAALLAGACLPLVFIVRRPVGLFGWVLGIGFTAVLLWIVVSTLWPGRADRTCPECGGQGLRRLDPTTTRGLECSECGWSDPDESSWMIAEEEGPLEEVVMRQRGRAVTGSKGASPSVDNDGRTD